MTDVRDAALRVAAALAHERAFHGLAYVGVQRPITGPEAEPAGPPAADEAPAGPDSRDALRDAARQWTPATKLEYLRRHNVGDCQRCGLARTRTHIVFGVGNPEAELMLVGEAPGAEEDRRGEPFVGAAGQRLDEWLVELGLSRQQVYIANVLKCRPPGNRDPAPEEVDRCSPFLHAQIRAMRPKVLVALGRHAGMLLSGKDDLPLRAMRQAVLQYRDPKLGDPIPLFVTYHPAWVLRQERDGADAASVNQMVLADLRRALGHARAPTT